MAHHRRSLSGFSDVRTWLPYGGTHYRDPELARGTSHETATVKGYTQEIFADDAVAFLTLAGLQAPASWPGRDLLPGLRDPKSGPAEAFVEWADDQGKFGAQAFRLIRTQRHKLILWKDPARKSELYDFVADPEEKVNLLKVPEAQAVRRDLAARLKAWMTRTSDPALRWPIP